MLLENLRKDTARHVSEAPEQHKARRIPRPDTQAVATVQYHALCNQPLTWNVGKWLTISNSTAWGWFAGRDLCNCNSNNCKELALITKYVPKLKKHPRGPHQLLRGEEHTAPI